MEEGSAHSFKQSIVVFLDILGFSNKVKSTKAKDEVKKIFNILTYFKAWNTNNGENNFIEESDFVTEKYINKYISVKYNEIQEELRISYFSDSLVITLPYEEAEFDLKMFLIIRSLANLMSKLAIANYFSRGGIAIGEMLHEDNIFFGPAFLESHKIEEEIALYPRVVLSQKIVDKINPQMPYIAESEDGLKFVDMIEFMKINQPYTLPCQIKQLKKIIDENIYANSNNQKIKSKYEWLKSQLEKRCCVLNWFNHLRIWLRRFI